MCARNQETIARKSYVVFMLADDQQHVRAAMQANGFWDIDVVRAGTYAIMLRRWPEALDLAMDAVFEKPERDPNRFYQGFKLYHFESGRIDVKSARLTVAHFLIRRFR